MLTFIALYSCSVFFFSKLSNMYYKTAIAKQHKAHPIAKSNHYMGTRLTLSGNVIGLPVSDTNFLLQ